MTDAERDSAIADVLASLGDLADDEKLRESMTEGMRKVWADVPELMAALETVGDLRDKRIATSVDDFRRVLFRPKAEEMDLFAHYVTGAPKDANEQHPKAKTQVPFLSLLYLKHRHSREHARHFILGGGLQALSGLLDMKNLYMRGQAVETFFGLTSDDLFMWHPDKAGGGDEDAGVRKALQQLASTDFTARLLANVEGPTFPRGSFYCLQIFAFFIGWLRHYYTANQSLQLSAKVLGILKAHAAKTDIPKPEAELAKRLHEDFSRAGVAEAPASPADVLRSQGNRAFGSQEYGEAIKFYTEALKYDATVVALYTNRAFAYLKRAGGRRDFEACIADCDRAIKLDGTTMKAHFRKAQALVQLQRPRRARKAIEAAARLDSKSADVEALRKHIGSLEIDSDDETSDETSEEAPAAAVVEEVDD